ncbi:MAG: hypothetical protein B6244_12895 [Candidatus Cloacimonetes bacterium 4572_55]|nr:MAG: hypothetical protein B6244_12895 [Candidatus Cloacimonetes bacterium 4572_55]
MTRSIRYLILTSLVGVFLMISVTMIGCAKDGNKNETAHTSVGMEKVKEERIKSPQPIASSHYNTKYDFTLKDLEGNDVKLSDFAGKVVILDFWDTWCPPCKAEIPHFVELQKEYGDQGFQMIGAAFGQKGLSDVKKFVEKNNVDYVNLMATPEVIKQYGEGHDGEPIQGIPTTFVIDKKGNIYKKYVGFIEKSIFEKDIKNLLAEK